MLTEITVILDRSGSMQPIASDAIGGFNAFLAAQRREPSVGREPGSDTIRLTPRSNAPTAGKLFASPNNLSAAE